MMEVFVQKGAGKVEKAKSLDGIELADCKLLVVDLLDPSDDEIETVGKYFGLHPLTLRQYEEKASTPNIQEFPDHLYLTWDFLHDNPKTEVFEVSTLVIFVGTNYLVTMHSRKISELDDVHEKLLSDADLYKSNPAVVLYAIIDTAVDEYFPIVEDLTTDIDKYMEDLITEQNVGDLKSILTRKHRNMAIRRLATSHRDVVMKLARRDVPFIPDDLSVYLLDVYDHLSRIGQDIDTNTDLVSSSLDIHLNMVSNRMNITMKRLTTIATIFMPLTFIVGLYGMNFRIPEIHWYFGYLFVWILMIAVTIGMVLIAKKNAWF